MAPKIADKNFLYLFKLVGGWASHEVPVVEALNNVIPGSGNSLADLSLQIYETQDDASDEYEKRPADPYLRLGNSGRGVRFETEAEVNRVLRQENDLKNILRNATSDKRMNAYPAFKAFLNAQADLLDMSSKGIDTERERMRTPGMEVFTNGSVDWTTLSRETAAKDLNDMLTAMHYQEYIDASKSYMKAKQALDDPAISPVERKRQTAIVRQSLKDMDDWVEHCIDPKTAEKASKYFQDYGMNVQGARGYKGNIQSVVHSQLKALDMGWDPAYIEDFHILKQYSDFCSNSLEAFDQINNPMFAALKDKVQALAELNPEGREFSNRNEFIQFYQDYSNAAKDLFAEAVKPEINAEIKRLRKEGVFTAAYNGHQNLQLDRVFPALLEYGLNKSDVKIFTDLGFFAGRGDFASRGILPGAGAPQYDPDRIREREQNIIEMKNYAVRLKNESKNMLRLVNSAVNGDENNLELTEGLREKLSKMANMTPGDMNVTNLNFLVHGIGNEIQELNNNGHGDLIPQGLTAWNYNCKSGMSLYTPVRLSISESLNDQLDTIKKIKKGNLSEKYVNNSRIREPYADPRVEEHVESIKKSWTYNDEQKQELRQALMEANDPEVHPDAPEADKREMRIIKDALGTKGWNVTHAQELPKLIHITDAAIQYNYGLRVVNDNPKLDRFKGLVNELCELSPDKQDFNAPDKKYSFEEYNARTHAVLHEIIAESQKPEVSEILNRMRVIAPMNGTFIKALTGTVGVDTETNELKDCMDLMNPERYRFRGEPDINKTVKDVTLLREQKTAEKIGSFAERKFNKFKNVLDDNINERSDSYIQMKNALAKVAGIKNGDRVPGRVDNLLWDLYNKADDYENSHSGVLKSGLAEARVDMAKELKKFVMDARKEYKFVTNGNLEKMSSVFNQHTKVTEQLGKNPDALNAYQKKQMANSVYDFFKSARSTLKDIERESKDILRDKKNRENVRHPERQSDSYKMVTAQLQKLKKMGGLVESKPADIYNEINKTMLAAKKYMNDHTGFKGLFKAGSDEGIHRLEQITGIYNKLKAAKAELDKSYEGLRQVDPDKSMNYLARVSGLSISSQVPVRNSRGDVIRSKMKNKLGKEGIIKEEDENELDDEMENDNIINTNSNQKNNKNNIINDNNIINNNIINNNIINNEDINIGGDNRIILEDSFDSKASDNEEDAVEDKKKITEEEKKKFKEERNKINDAKKKNVEIQNTI